MNSSCSDRRARARGRRPSGWLEQLRHPADLHGRHAARRPSRAGTALGKKAKAVHGRGRAGARRGRDRHRRGAAAGSRLRQQGFILDGFPRTVPRPRRSTRCLARLARRSTHVICIEVPDDELVERLTRPAHLHAAAARCTTSCSTRRRRRGCATSAAASSTSATTTTRRRSATGCEVYDEQTAPLIDYYRQQGAGRATSTASGAIEDIYRGVIEGPGLRGERAMIILKSPREIAGMRRGQPDRGRGAWRDCRSR